MAEHKESAVRDEIVSILKQYNPTETLKLERDALGRYRIMVGQPLAEFSSLFAKAYVVSDQVNPGAQLYALVFDNEVPLRQKHIDFLREFRHPNMVSLLAVGAVEISTLAE